MLVADEHPGAFLEDEVPFAPRTAEPAPAPSGRDPWGWFQRWRVPITALFVVLIALAVALAFGAKPDPPPARAPLGSAPVTPESVGDPPRSSSTAAPVDTTASPPPPPPPPSAPALPAASAGGPVAVPTAPGPASTATTVPASATSVVSSPATSPATGPSTTRPPAAVTTVTVTQPPPTPAPTTLVPGYATGSTQARGPNDPPFVANPGLVTSAAGQAVRYQIGVSARPGEVLTFSATGLPRGLSIDPATGLVTGTPKEAETTGVQVTVTSSAGSRFTQGFTWVVNR